MLCFTFTFTLASDSTWSLSRTITFCLHVCTFLLRSNENEPPLPAAAVSAILFGHQEFAQHAMQEPYPSHSLCPFRCLHMFLVPWAIFWFNSELLGTIPCPETHFFSLPLKIPPKWSIECCHPPIIYFACGQCFPDISGEGWSLTCLLFFENERHSILRIESNQSSNTSSARVTFESPSVVNHHE